MKYLLLILFAGVLNAKAQNTFRAIIKDQETKEPLTGATAVVEGLNIGAASDMNGNVIITDIPPGKQVIAFSFIGYETRRDTFNFPLNNAEVREIHLSPSAGHLEETVIEATRTNRSISDIPTRVEVLTEEIDEAGTMDPSKISHLITHSTGIQVQQTSATSGTANVRIQGLDGRYTQILKDGFPLYGGFSGSLSILQIPPLDLRQVEYVKGSASTLYGGGAIAGLINLLSKEPKEEPEFTFHFNQSHIGQTDMNAFYSKRENKVGFTFFASRNIQRAYDPDKDGYSDLPEIAKYNLNPKLYFFFSKKTKMYLGATLTDENRAGGSMELLKEIIPDSIHFYRESNDSRRITTQIKIDHKLNENNQITIKNSFNFFNRSIELLPDTIFNRYVFAGNQAASFSEAAFNHLHKKHTFITGLNFYSDYFNERKLQSFVLRNEYLNTAGAFAQYSYNTEKKLSFETGIRTDYNIELEKLFILPRIAANYKITQKLSTRFGAGLGYRLPTIFNQEAELLAYKDVLPIDYNTTDAEQSYGGNLDITYRTSLGENVWMNINQLFFYTYLANPLVLTDTAGSSGIHHFKNSNGYADTKGFETQFKLGFYDFVWFVGYTYTDALIYNSLTYTMPLTPKHSIKGDLLYGTDKWRIGADYEYKSSQFLSGSGRKTPDYWTFGVIAQRFFEKWTVYINFENFTDVRQTRFESLRSAPYGTPQFTEVWAPLDGFYVNGGFKVSF